MFRNLWKSVLICGVAICGSSFLVGQEGNGGEKPNALLRTAGDRVATTAWISKSREMREIRSEVLTTTD